MTFPFVMPMAGLIGSSSSSLSFSLRGSAKASGSSITTPSSTVAGDLIIFAEYARNSDAAVAPTSVIPTGFTQIGSSLSATAGSEGFRCNVAYKIATSADAGASRTGMSDNYMAKVMLVFNPGSTITTTTPSTWNAQITSGDPRLQTVTATGQPTPLIVFGITATPTNGTTFDTTTPSFDAEVAQSGSVVASSVSIRIGYTVYNSESTPTDHSIDDGDSGAMNALLSGYLRFT